MEKKTYEEMRREINRICNVNTDYKLNNDFFGKWFIEAFPENEDERYILEWIERFMKGTPFMYMDRERLEVYFKAVEEWTGYKR